jgi:hypothetical protein
VLTLTGNVGTIQWQSSTNGTSYANIVGATGSSYTATNLTATTYYRALVTSGVCLTETTNAQTITVDPTSVAGSIAGAQTVCYGTNTTTLTLSGNTGTIQWQSSLNNSTFTNISGANASTYVANDLFATTYYRAVITSGVCSSINTASVTVSVSPATVAGSISGAQTVCYGTNTTTLTLGGHVGIIQWQSSADNTSFSNIAGATASTYVASNLTATTYYRAVVTSGVCASLNTTSVSVVVSSTSVAGTVTGAQTVCYGTNTTTLTLSGNTGNIQWQSSSNNSTFTNISGANASTYVANNLTATTYYRAVLTSGVCSSVNTSSVTVTVSPATVAGTITGAQTVCYGTNTTTLTLSGNVGTIQWQSSSDNSSFADIAGATASTFVASNLTATTYYRAVVTSGVCESLNTASVTVVVSPTSVAGPISGAQTVCYGTNTTTLTLSDYVGSIQWQSSLNNSSFTNISGATASTYVANNLTATTYYRAVLTSGVCSSVNTSSVTVTVSPATVAGTISGAQTVCYGTNSTTLLLNGSVGSIQWQLSSDNTSFADIAGATASTYVASSLTATTYYRAVVTSGVCASINTASVTIGVSPSTVAGTISGAQTVCYGTNTTTLTLNGSVGAIQWQSSLNNTTFTNISGATTSTYVANNLTATTYYRAVLTSGVCSSVNTSSVTVSVSPTTIAGTISGAQTVCYGTNSTTLLLNGSVGTIQWQSSSDNTSFTDIAGATATTYVASSLTATTYYRAVVTSGVCASINTASVTVGVSPSTVAGTITGATEVCSGTNSTVLTLEGSVGAIQWKSSTDGINFTNISGATGSTYTASNLVVTTYYKAVVTSGVCSAIETPVVNMVVNYATYNSFTASNCDAYEWNGTTYTNSGVYTYNYSNTFGCASVDTLHLTIRYSNSSDTSASICDRFTWMGTTYTTSGNFQHTFTNVAGCDSLVTLHLTIRYKTNSSLVTSALNSYTWNGNVYEESGVYTFNTSNAVGCDSTATLILTINATDTSSFVASACDSYTLPWGDVATVSGDYEFHYSNYNGFDSLVTAHIIINNSVTHSVDTTGCDSFVMPWGEVTTVSGSFSHHYETIHGCDSLVTFNVTMYQSQTSSFDAVSCDSYTLPWSEVVTTSGDYTHHYVTVNGCDSLVTAHVIINGSTSSSFEAAGCDSYTLPWNEVVVLSGDYSHTYQTETGCDSIVTAHISMSYRTATEFAAAGCDTYTLPWGTEVTASGDYTHHYTTEYGCDSLVTAHVEMNYSTSTEFDATSCDSYVLPWGTEVNVTGDYTHDYSTINGCDSLVTAHVVINYSNQSEFNIVGCNTVTLPWNEEVTLSGDYTHIYTNENGCDSTVTAHVVINSSMGSDFSEVGCDTYTLPWNEIVTVSGVYQHTYSTASGCDSLVTAHITILASTSGEFADEACDSYLLPWGETVTTTGDYQYHYLNAEGCDSLVTAHITVHQRDSSEFDATACMIYTLPWGVDVIESGDYVYHYETVFGCDSAVTAHITIYSSRSSEFDVTSCDTYELPWGENVTLSGNYEHTYSTENGCDSIVTAHVTINYSNATEFEVVACDSARMPWNQLVLVSGDYMHHYTNEFGCDSAVTAHVTIHNAVSTEFTASNCNNYSLPWGALVTVSGDYTHHYVSQYGCDSMVTVHVVILPKITVTQTVTSCDSYMLPWGLNAITSGTYSRKYVNQYGCDSIVVYYVTIRYSATSAFTASNCDSYTLPWGAVVTTSGDYVNLYQTIYGCDSTVTAHITIYNSTTNEINVSSCDRYTLPWGTVVTTSGSYEHHYNTSNGCDSMVTVNAIINSSYQTSFEAHGCDSYTLPWGQTVTNTGTYSHIYQSASGCDSIVRANVVITYNYASEFTDAACGEYALPWGVTATASGDYVYHYSTVDGCDSMVTAHITINQSSNSLVIAAACNYYNWSIDDFGSGMTYTESGTYTYESVNELGCTHFAVLQLTVNQASSSMTDVTICTVALPYSWNGNDYTESGMYDVTLVSSNGCDSIATLNLVAIDFNIDTIVGNKNACPYLGTTTADNATYSVASTNAVGYVWTIPANATLISGQGTNAITVHYATAFTGGNVKVAVTGVCGSVLADSITITKSLAPVPGLITGTLAVCPNITGETYTIDPVIDANSYTWTVPTSWSIVSGNGTTEISVLTGGSGRNGNITVKAVNGCGLSEADTLAVTVKPGTPAVPGTISGTAVQCPNLTGKLYSIAAVLNATTYNWTVPAGWVITSGNGTTSITVNTGISGENGNITVTAGNSCGTSVAKILAVTVSPATPGVPGSITGSTVVCPSTTGNIYTISAVDFATSYSWTVPTGWSIIAGQGTTSITVSAGTTAQSGSITVKSVNSCGTSAATSLAITVSPAIPATPGNITGTLAQCPSVSGLVYSITAVTNATNYNWTVPTGWTITSGAGTTSITVTSGLEAQNGNVTVTSQNSCGISAPKSIAVTVKAGTPIITDQISGSPVQCPSLTGQIYSIPQVLNATSYVWTVPTGWSIAAGNTTNSITVSTGTLAQTGTITVKAINSCGTSLAQSMTVVVNNPKPATPGLITGTTTQCPYIPDQVYRVAAVANATSYNWVIPTGWAITSGEGSPSITVTTGSDAQGGIISVSALNSCGISALRTITVAMKPGTPATPGTITGLNNQCTGLTGQAYSVPAVANATTYTWTAPVGWTITASGSTTNAITVSIGSTAQAGQITVKANNSCGTSATSIFNVVVNPGTPATPGTITGAPKVCPGASTTTYTVAAVTNATIYNWVVPTGWSIVSGANTNSITVAVQQGASNGSISVSVGNSCGTSAIRSLSVSVNAPTPVAPTLISGRTTQCPSVTSQQYSIGAVANATTYIWSVPTGWLITAGNGTTTATVKSGLTGQNGNIAVTASNSCGVSAPTYLGVTVLPAKPSTPGTITGLTSQCAGTTGLAYSIAAVSNATIYQWTLPAGWSIASGAGTNAITVNLSNAAITGTVSVTAGNSCGTSTARTSTVTIRPAKPATPGAIIGSAAQCPGLTGQVYTVAAVTNATSYQWTVPTGWTVTAGAGTNSITVKTGLVGQNGNITVTATNSCGTSAASTKAVTVNPGSPAIMGSISGLTSQCPSSLGVVYSVAAVANVTSYNWTLPAGWSIISGTGTNVITVNVGYTAISGNITVTGVNSCGSTTTSSLAVTVNPPTPIAPNSISGTAVQCPGNTNQVYTSSAVANATSYQWTVPIGWTITSGAGTNVINVTTGTANQNGDITVTASNSCGVSAAMSLPVIVNASVPDAPSSIAGLATQCPNLTAQAYSVNEVPNASSYNWTLPAGWIITSGNYTSSILVAIGSNAQNGVIAVSATNSCGTSNLTSLPVTVSLATPIAPKAINGLTSQCIGVDNQVYNVEAVANATIYNWSVPTGWLIASGAGTNSITVSTTALAQNGNITVSAANSCGTSDANVLAVTVNPLTPVTPGLISGTVNQCAGSGNQVYAIDAVPNATYYSWTVPNDWNIVSGNSTQSIIVSVGSLIQSGTISVVAANICGVSSLSTLEVMTNPAIPARPGMISGVTNQCSSMTNQVYSIDAISNATSYTWSVPTGWVITEGQGTRTITVTTGSPAQNGNITVNASNSCGTSASSILAATVLPATPTTPGTISGLTSQCEGTASQLYSITDVTNTSIYTWTVPTGWSIISGAGTRMITVTVGAAGQNGDITVTASNSCGTSLASILSVVSNSVTPTAPLAITGTAVQCPSLTNQVYSIAAVTNAASYNWSVPTGWTITSGAGTNSITVTTGIAGQNGNVSVTASNSCGTSAAKTLSASISGAVPATPGVITGTVSQCQNITGQTYMVSAVTNATSYQWTVPTGWTITSGQGTRAIVVAVTASAQNGTMSVVASNSCGASASRTLALTVKPGTPVTPGVITGITAQCQTLVNQTYSVASVANATLYTWTVPTGWTITAGAGTNTIKVSTGLSGQNGNITVRAANSCGSSAAKTLTVTVTACTIPIARTTSTINLNAEVEPTINVSVYPNPSAVDFKIKVITTNQNELEYKVVNTFGNVVKYSTIEPNQTIIIGSDFKPGVYFLEVKQGLLRKTTRLIKF